MMTFRSFPFVLLFVFSLSASAHDYHLCFTKIFQKEGKWFLKITFGAGGLEQSIKKSYNTSNLSISSTDFKEKVLEYLNEHISVRANKTTDAQLVSHDVDINHHACEFTFILADIPLHPIFWEVKIDACSDYPQQRNQVRLSYMFKESNFPLHKSNQFSIALMRGENGGFKAVQ